MTDTIKCKNCGNEIEVSEALRHQVEEQLLNAERKKHQNELEAQRKDIEAKAAEKAEKESAVKIKTSEATAEAEKKRSKELLDNIGELTKKVKVAEQASVDAKANLQKRLDEQKTKMRAEIKEEFSKQQTIELEDMKRQLTEQETRVTEFKKQELELRAEKRKLEEQQKDIDLEVQRKVDTEKGKLLDEAKKKAEENQQLKLLEKDKQLQDALKVNAELKRKLEQGSQQLQGEVMELELERILKAEFPLDDISEIKKGVRGADVRQNIINANGQSCGAILWETKNGKWQTSWPAKLREDQRQAKTDLAVLVCEHLPEGIENFVFKDSVWITNRQSVVGLAYALRYNIIQLYMTKQASKGKNEKMEVLFSYLIGPEFRHRVEAIVEAFSNLQGEVEREKRSYQAKWARQEKEIRKVIDHTVGLYGDLQGITGRALPSIKTLELPEPEEDEKEK